MSDFWFDTKGKTSDEEPSTPEELQALKEFLIGETSASVAAKRLMTMSENEKPLSDKINRVVWLVFDAAIHFQSQQIDVLELIEAIQSLSSDDLGFSIQQKERYPTWSTWNDFDRFEVVLDDMRRSYWAYRYLPDEEDDDPCDCYRRWASLNALLAHRCVRSTKPSYPPSYGISVICEAFEQEPWKHPPSRPLLADEAKKFDITILDAEVPAAAKWILIAGREIFECVDTPSFATRLEPSDLWHDDKPGLSRERWALWKTRLQWVGQQDVLNKETKTLAKEALDKMHEIDADMPS